MRLALTLVHSPIVGPLTWAPVAEELERRGFEVLMPVLEDGVEPRVPYWERHAQSVANSLGGRAPEGVVLAAHSGAGQLLPAIAQRIASPSGYVFVDASLPEDNQSRLGQLAAELPAAAQVLGEILASGQAAPDWSDADLREEIPDARLRHDVIAQLRPRPARFYQEPIPVFDGWPDAPCAYLQFSRAYDRPAAQARERGWPYRRVAGSHFHMLVDPSAVADALVDVVSTLTR
jgi:hypothetical protein